MKLERVIFVGGGSGGHVMPALTLIDYLKERGIRSSYIGSKQGIERRLVITKVDRYWPIFTGKLRRYFSFENALDLCRVFLGFVQTLLLLRHYSRSSTLIFSTGGFVSVPVALASFVMRFKFVVHEQTSRAGLANKIASHFAAKVFVSFESSIKEFGPKAILTGYPLRSECLDSLIRRDFFQTLSLKNDPYIFITGGGSGAKILNDYVKNNLNRWTKDFKVVHQVGKNQINEFSVFASDRYIPVEFVSLEMVDLMKGAKIVLSRAGAGTVLELMALKKGSIFVPLKIAQKNEQYFNALEAQKLLGSVIVAEENLAQFDLLTFKLPVRSEEMQNSVDAREVIFKEITLQ